MSLHALWLLFLFSFGHVLTEDELEKKVEFLVLTTLSERIHPGVYLPDTPTTTMMGWMKLQLTHLVLHRMDSIKVAETRVKISDDSGIHFVMKFQFDKLVVKALHYYVGIFFGHNNRPDVDVENQITAFFFFKKSTCSIELKSVIVQPAGFDATKMCRYCWVTKDNPINTFIRNSIDKQLITSVTDALKDARINRSIYSTCPTYIRDIYRKGADKYLISGQEVLLDLVPVEPDGACLFNALSMGMYGSQAWNQRVREDVVDYVVAHYDHYGNFITYAHNATDYSEYMRRHEVFGTATELHAAVDLYQLYCIVIRDGVVVDTQGVRKGDTNTVILRFSGHPDAGHFELLWPPKENKEPTQKEHSKDKNTEEN